MATLLGATTVKMLLGTYSGFTQNFEPVVVPLLGRDPAVAINEVIQSTAMGAKEASFQCWCDTAAERDVLVAKLATQTTFDDGSGDPVRNVTVLGAAATRDGQSALYSKYTVSIKLRER